MNTSTTVATTVLLEGRARIDEMLAKLRPDDLLAIGIGGGAWSPKDLLGHLALWQEIALRTIEEARRGSKPWITDVFASGDGPNDAELVARAPWPLGRVRDAYERSAADVIAAIGSMELNEWSRRVPGSTDRSKTVGALLGSVLGKEDMPFGHAFAHLADLESFVAGRAPQPAEPRTDQTG